jgi:hypothetical protein
MQSAGDSDKDSPLLRSPQAQDDATEIALAIICCGKSLGRPIVAGLRFFGSR